MARKKSKAKKKTKQRRSPKQKETELNKLKKTLSDLHTRVKENLGVILTQTQMTNDELGKFIQLNGYNGLKKLPNLKIAEPILNQMIKTFVLYDKVSTLVERMQEAEERVFLSDVEKKTLDLENQAKQIEEEDKFYTEKPDQAGFVKMKEKYFKEKEHWEQEKAIAQSVLADYPEDQNALAKLSQAERELDILRKKRNWARIKNVQPNIVKYTQKVQKVINTVQDSIQEVTKPFAQIGEMSGYSNSTPKESKKKQKNEYEEMFSPEAVFGKGY